MSNILLKIKYSFVSALVFFIVANPEFYTFTSSIFGYSGIVLHTVIFFLVMLALMTIPRNT